MHVMLTSLELTQTRAITLASALELLAEVLIKFPLMDELVIYF